MHTCAFIFDMDGVIVDSNPYHKIALQQFCAKHGHTLSDEELHTKVYGRTNKQWLTNLFGALPPNQLAEFAQEKEALYRQLYKDDIQPVAGLVTFLEAMDAAMIRRAIGTSAPRVNVDFTLSGTNTTRFFDVILDDSFVTVGKPNPEIYIKAAAHLGFDPSNCIVFEDSLSGIEAGKRAGCKVVGIATTHTHAELFDTDYVLDDFSNIDPVELIKRLKN